MKLNPDTVNQFEQIVKLRLLKNYNAAEIAKEINLSIPRVTKYVQILDGLRSEDYTNMIHGCVNAQNTSFVYWASEYLNRPIPPEIISTMENALEAERQKAKDRELRRRGVAPAAEPVPPSVIPEKVDSIDYTLFLQTISLDLKALIEEMKQLMDVVLPLYSKHLNDNINAGNDIIFNELKLQSEKMEGIKNTVKAIRKGNN